MGKSHSTPLSKDQFRVYNEVSELIEEKITSLREEMESKMNILSSNPEYRVELNNSDIKLVLILILIVMILNFLLNIYQSWKRSLKKRYTANQNDKI